MTLVPTLETPRLWLRPAVLEDAPAIQRRFPQWDVVRYLDAVVPWPYPADGAEQHVRRLLAKDRTGETFDWCIWLKDGPDEPIGLIDLRSTDSDRDENGQWRDNRGFWLDPEFAGRGLMTEASDRVVDFAFRELGWPRLILSNAAPNAASGRIKQKQGARLIATETRRFVSGEFPREVWLLEAEGWLARRGCLEPGRPSDV